MPTVFKHALVTQIGTNPTDVVEIGAGVRATVIGCNLANVTEYDTVVVDIQVVGVDTTVAYYVKGLIIPPMSVLLAAVALYSLILFFAMIYRLESVSFRGCDLLR